MAWQFFKERENKMLFDDSIGFFGTYRPYQQRALDQIERFLDNQKIHIVAAPGSGKTILGLEIIRRLDQKTLVLVPTITIREQWIERFCHGFLKDEKEKDKWISNDILQERPIICMTYQALYSAYKGKNQMDISEENDGEEEQYTYDNFHLIETLKKYQIKTLCLDECHHLKSEWWKALESTVKELDDIKIVALTATPPYDSSPQEWQRYIDLCGPIDDEIFVPELIKDRNLCPHQDYVYFSFPTPDEEKLIMKYYSNGIKAFNKYKHHPELLEIIMSNSIYKDYKAFKKAYYTNSPYYRAFIIYLVENKVSVPPMVYMLSRVEPLNITHFECLLQQVLFDDQDSYQKSSLIVSMKKEFSALGIVNKRKVNLAHDERVDKILSTSKGKLKSIAEIVRFENASLNKDLKCLILTDYIKMKAKSLIHTDKEITTIGTIPIFEYLRREEIKNITLCLLSGSICIIPKNSIHRINEIFEGSKNFSFEEIVGTDYVEIMVKDANRKKLVSSITQLFQEGYFNVVVGTKALLGEGWDSPCINTLIMASVVGSYVLSNQTRGRAIRTDMNNPNKVSNVWHLACLDPYDSKFSADYYTLQKRFSTFVGVDSKKKNIEDGLERLNLSFPPRNHYEAEIVNNEMIKNSIMRNKTKEMWDKCIEDARQIEVLTKITYLSKKRLRKTYSFYVSLISSILWLSLYFISFQSYAEFIEHTSKDAIVVIFFLMIIVLISYFFVLYFMRVLRQLTPTLKLKSLGITTLNALKKSGIVQAKTAEVVVYKENADKIAIYLENASTYEQNIFSDCIVQMLGEIQQPRYLLARPKRFFQREFYIVPDLFKKNKDTVQVLKKEMDRQFGTFAAVFAKNEHGKSLVLRAQYIYFTLYRESEITVKRILLKKKKKIRLNKDTLFKKEVDS